MAMLRLQAEWGADEALGEEPCNRLVEAPSRVAWETGREAGQENIRGNTQEISRPALVRTLISRSEPAPVSRLLGGQAQQAEEVSALADTLDALRTAVREFDGCALRDTASHTLFAHGDPGSGLMLIGEVPDADEDRAGHPFAGASGALLDRMLDSVGLSRGGMMITPLIPWRPPGDRKPSPVEMAACLPFLYRLVALAQPRHLLLMGVRPTRAFMGADASLPRLRGRWMTIVVPGTDKPVQMLPMRHPGHLLTNPPARRESWHDLLLLRRTLDAELSQRRDELLDEPR